MKKTKYKKAIDKLNAERHLHLKKLIQMPFEKLEALKKQYSEIYTYLEESGYNEAAEVHFLHFLIIEEAVTVKHGNMSRPTIILHESRLSRSYTYQNIYPPTIQKLNSVHSRH